MRYTSTRDSRLAAQSAAAIQMGMVPGGGLFVPVEIPRLDLRDLRGRSYQQVAHHVLSALLTDFSPEELWACVERAYNPSTFDIEPVIDLVPLDSRRSVMELWHGPTAAFKDVALQIMPGLLRAAKGKLGDALHTVILVATSGDTGKAALEGFKDAEAISIIVFYPHGGVSEIQKLQMATTGGSNTHVLAVRGNFDDCQTGVKQLFGDEDLKSELAKDGFAFSSANSINWGRLCPQIVYYFHAYLCLLERGLIAEAEPIDFCVPTGNFGNILAAFYARAMGLPVDRLVCASNKNKILADFFSTGVYDRNREFYRTMSPSMDILISSNLERFLFEASGHDAGKINEWYPSLARTGRFAVDRKTRTALDEVIIPGWVDEPRVLETIRKVHEASGYVLDTHTAVAVAVGEDVKCAGRGKRYTVIASTASPYKFSGDVLLGLRRERVEDELESMALLHELSGTPIHRAVAGLREKPVRHDRVIDVGSMREATLEIIEGLRASRAPGR
jgi:threonine synthase